MRARALFAGTILVLVLAFAAPAAAKAMIAEAHISGPGLGGGGLRISGSAVDGMWESGIDVAGGLDDGRANSIAELGLTTAELGPKYIVSYRLEVGTTPTEVFSQELNPYANGGPVTYAPREQRLAEGRPWEGAISAGWYQSSLGFFQYLIDQGLPELSPVTRDASRESAPDALPAAPATSWRWIALALVGLVALLLAASGLRRRT